MKLKLLIAALVCLGLTACSLKMPSLKIPRVHKITVQQGNVITQEMVDRLKPGMTRSQVAFVMGQPVIRNTFNPDRWDYLYSLVVPEVFEQDVRMTLYFENDVLAYFTGDLVPTDAVVEGDETAATDTDVEETPES